VIEMGRLLPDSLPLERSYETRRVKMWFRRGAQFYAEYNIRLFFYLIFAKVDLIFANDLDTLPAAYYASKIRGKRLIYDTHEYFTEVPELVKRPKIQVVWRKIENHLFPKLTDIFTVNESIAKLYSEKFGKKVHVIRNIPPTHTPEKNLSRKELGLPENKRILILQGAGINIQRGAEEACLAMQYLDDAVLLVVGSGDVIPELKKIVAEHNLQAKVIFKNKMPFAELRQYTINSDLGLAIDKNTNLNYQFSLPNKLFDYIHSNIPILSSELIELKQIIDQYEIGYYIENHDPKHIVETIKRVFVEEERYTAVKKNTEKAKKELCWENEEKILLEVINKKAE